MQNMYVGEYFRFKNSLIMNLLRKYVISGIANWNTLIVVLSILKKQLQNVYIQIYIQTDLLKCKRIEWPSNFRLDANSIRFNQIQSYNCSLFVKHWTYQTLKECINSSDPLWFSRSKNISRLIKLIPLADAVDVKFSVDIFRRKRRKWQSNCRWE